MNGEVVVISGGSAGVGRATARQFARQGCPVAVLARGEIGLAGTVTELQSVGAQALGLAVDVADPQQVKAAAQKVERQLGEIDVWVNCAMVTVFSPVNAMTSEEYRRVTEVNYLGTVYGTQAALDLMRPRGRGSIIQVGSALSYRAVPLQSAYCGSKFAIRGFTDAVRAELLFEGSPIHVCMVQLAAFNTPQFDCARSRLGTVRPRPLPPVLQPELAADAICWAARHRRRELWVGSSTIKTIVATLLFPRLTERLAAKKAWLGQYDRRASSLPANHPTDNLFSPLAGDHGAHGRFDAEAKSRSGALMLVKQRGWALAVMVVVVGVALLMGLVWR